VSGWVITISRAAKISHRGQKWPWMLAVVIYLDRFFYELNQIGIEIARARQETLQNGARQYGVGTMDELFEFARVSV